MGAEIPVAYIVNNITATPPHSGACVTTQIFRKNICLHKQYTVKEKTSFPKTSKLLFSRLERRIVHDEDQMILQLLKGLSQHFCVKRGREKVILVYAHFRQIQLWLSEKKLTTWSLNLVTSYLFQQKRTYIQFFSFIKAKLHYMTPGMRQARNKSSCLRNDFSR